MRRNTNGLIATALLIIAVGVYFFITRLPRCSRKLTITTFSPSGLLRINVSIFHTWHIPDWVQRYNVSHLFDWTWHKNGDYERCQNRITPPPHTFGCRAESPTVVNDALEYFRSHYDEGCIVDNAARLPNLVPHPLPRARSFFNTCYSLHINRAWALCRQRQSELDGFLPATTRFVTIAAFNAFVDTGHCHADVPGTVFTEEATFHLQGWTGKSCGNDAIDRIPQIEPKYRHKELINSIGTYLHAPGHFGPQQLPRLLRLLATAPETAKVLVAKGGVADSLLDVLIERGVVTRDRIVPFDQNARPNHFANMVYRSDSWPYLRGKEGAVCIHDRTDMQLVHRVLVGDEQPPISKRDRLILIKRKDGHARSIVEHLDMALLMASVVNKSKVPLNLHIEVFEARGHIRDHIALFRRARVIIGPHGAGMMNILWASPGTRVVEVGYTTGMTFPEMYAEMSLHLEHHYWVCKGYGDYSSPIHVDMEDFTYIFNEIIHEIEIEDQLSSWP
ncbi:unnamed protein product [Rotaria socialis]|uniref:Glycosyltransferase 61 catalytic domain-containing protein n=1 Tax=Rotaria socialis TaxID=392032 RepID=A0A818PK21_9BILA|nr:unnamed protein product [Rotaria socialis]CAF3625937.1 unnamed protein product [Rotaria socialis]CAF3738859.1 unnamed protein product [Rotaria socialis]CAF4481578.1 unnamed protein product [Rotaria socialis]CAF4604345.1 unnamed protein product [Rotaria socialis]